MSKMGEYAVEREDDPDFDYWQYLAIEEEKDYENYMAKEHTMLLSELEEAKEKSAYYQRMSVILNGDKP